MGRVKKRDPMKHVSFKVENDFLEALRKKAKKLKTTQSELLRRFSSYYLLPEIIEKRKKHKGDSKKVRSIVKDALIEIDEVEKSVSILKRKLSSELKELEKWEKQYKTKGKK
ncbi:MAG: hypothetical protein WBD99_02515 [Thermodesulfobacteriota bacterium]